MARFVAIVALVVMLGVSARRARVPLMQQTAEAAETETTVEPMVGKSFGLLDGCPEFVILSKDTCYDKDWQSVESTNCCDKLRECDTAANDLIKSYTDRLLVYRDQCGIDSQTELKFDKSFLKFDDSFIALLNDVVCSEKCQSLEALGKPKEDREELLGYCDEERLKAYNTKMEQAQAPFPLTRLLEHLDHAWSHCCPTGYHVGEDQKDKIDCIPNYKCEANVNVPGFQVETTFDKKKKKHTTRRDTHTDLKGCSVQGNIQHSEQKRQQCESECNAMSDCRGLVFHTWGTMLKRKLDPKVSRDGFTLCIKP